MTPDPTGSRRARDAVRDREFTEFVAARQQHLHRIAWAVCGDRHRADDVLQASLVKLYLAWPRLRDLGAAEAYARRIIVRADVDDRRRPWRRERCGLDGVEPPSTTPHDESDERAVLFQALQSLPPMQRRTVVLRHWLGLSVEETARELGIGTGTVKSHSSRALAALQLRLAASEA